MCNVSIILKNDIVGILLYQILKNNCGCKNIEGFGLFGRVNINKCCPIDYMYSDTEKKCVTTIIMYC